MTSSAASSSLLGTPAFPSGGSLPTTSRGFPSSVRRRHVPFSSGSMAARKVVVYKAPPAGDLGEMMKKAVAQFSAAKAPCDDFYFEIELNEQNAKNVQSIVAVTKELLIDKHLCKTAYIIIKTKEVARGAIQGLVQAFAKNHLTATETPDVLEKMKKEPGLFHYIQLKEEEKGGLTGTTVLGVHETQGEDEDKEEEIEVDTDSVRGARRGCSTAVADERARERARAELERRAASRKVDDSDDSDDSDSEDEEVGRSGSAPGGRGAAASASSLTSIGEGGRADAEEDSAEKLD